MGRFRHEAAAVDPRGHAVYLTEDEPDGCLYRFRPESWADLSSGTLEVLCDEGGLRWVEVPDPDAEREATRHQVPGATRFDGGEGAWFSSASCWFTTKGDNRIWRYSPEVNDLTVVYDDTTRTAPLNGVDNLTLSTFGEIFVAEDKADMEICTVSTGRTAPFLRIVGHDDSEITGPAFSPDGTRLYFSSQRGPDAGHDVGVTYEVTGPFRRPTPVGAERPAQPTS